MNRTALPAGAVAIAVAAALTVAVARAEEPPAPPPPPPAPTATAPAAPGAAGAAAGAAPAVDPRARKAFERAHDALYTLRSAGVKQFQATVTVEGTPVGPVPFAVSWTRGADGAADTTEVRVDESVDASMRPVIEAQAGTHLRQFVETLVVGPAKVDVLADCEATCRDVEGGVEVVSSYVRGEREGTRETRRFAAATGLPEHLETFTATGQTVVTDRTFEKQGERHRLAGMTQTVTSPAGQPITLETRLHYYDCGGVAVLWKLVRESIQAPGQTLVLSRVSVDGKAWPTPDEQAAAAKKPAGEGAAPAGAPPPSDAPK